MTQLWKISLVLMAVLLLSFRSDPASVQDDTNKQILAALTAGNVVVLSSFFNNMIDLGITGNEDTYSKTQATQILKDFFTKNPIKSVKFTSEGSSTDGSQFTIGEMKAGTGTYRLYYLLKKISGKFLIQQLQIQKQN
ncbi:MAG: DUF4783 domain-containing protein [Bacteroidales bacterium]|jgi:hypothetical protein